MSKPEPYEVPTSCPVCTSCWLDTRYGRCSAGGPYLGYSRGMNVEDKDGKPLGRLKLTPRFFNEGDLG